MRSSKIGSVIVGAVMAYGVVGVSIPTVSHAQSAQGPTTQATDMLNGSSQTDTTTGIQTTRQADQPNPNPSVDAEINRRFNELRSELLDDRASTINWWLAVVGLVLTFFAIAVPLLGLLGYRRFKEIEKEAQESAEEAKRFVEEIKQIRDKSHEILRDMTAEKAVDDPAAEEKAEAVSKDPDASLMDRAIARAISLQKEGEIEEAIKIWQGIAYSNEEIDNDLAARAWFSVGYLKSERGDKTNLEEVICAYNESIRLNPENAGAYNNRGIAKADLDRYEDAIVDYDEAIRLNPENAGAYNNRGIVKADLDRYEDAIVDYDEAIRLNPENAGAYNNRGIAKANLDWYEDAIVDYDEAIRLNPKNAGTYSIRGIAKAKLGIYEAAIADYGEAIRLKPDDAGAYFNRGDIKARIGQYEDAIVDCDRAIELNPNHALTYNSRGIANAELGRIAEARTDFEKALDIAKRTGDAEVISLAEKNLHALDNTSNA